MRTTSLRARLVVACTLGAAMPAGTAAALPVDGLRTNVRPFFAVGQSLPVRFADVDRGVGLAFGFEAEQSPRTSFLFRVDWSRMRGEPPPAFPYYGPSTFDLTAINWSMGGRLHLRTGGRLRPYADGCVGVRVVSRDRGDGIVIPAIVDLSRNGVGDAHGLTVTLRLGISTARPGRAGLFLDSGLEMLAGNLDHDGIAPLRLGIVFP